jgi:hypothetical protein
MFWRKRAFVGGRSRMPLRIFSAGPANAHEPAVSAANCLRLAAGFRRESRSGGRLILAAHGLGRTMGQAFCYP